MRIGCSCRGGEGLTSVLSLAAQRRWCSVSAPEGILPWKSTLPPPSHPAYHALGRCIVQKATALDTGPVAFQECFVARRQLESVVRSCGYDMSVFPFGGLVIMNFLEVGGDVDFVGIGDVEPSVQEAGEIISRITRELRRLGFRAAAIPKARVPVAKVQRTSFAAPGTPPDALSSSGTFHFVRPVTEEESTLFHERLTQQYRVLAMEWDAARQAVTVSFDSTSSLVDAIARVKKLGSVEIPLRLPVDPRRGPELYRYPFDLCLSSTGLRNSTLLSQSMSQYAYSRHLLLMLKRWGRASGIVNTLDGLMSSYALTVMLIHFLTQIDVIPLVETSCLSNEPQLLPKEQTHRPLQGIPSDDEMAQREMSRVGFLLAAFFEYYSREFPFSDKVICTTHKNVKKSMLHWDVPQDDSNGGRPPFFYMAMKDPFGLDNICRNVDHLGVQYIVDAIRQAHRELEGQLLAPSSSEGERCTQLLTTLTESPPRPPKPPTPGFLRQSSDAQGDDQKARDTAVYEIKKMEFQRRRAQVDRFGTVTVRRGKDNVAASNVAQSMTSWLRSDTPQE